MRTALKVGASVLALGTAFAAGLWAQAGKKVVWHWPDSLEAVNADPQEHKILYEDKHIRLLEVNVVAGTTGPMHGHKYPSVFAYDSVQPSHIDHVMEGDTKTSRGRVYEDADWSVPQCRSLGIQGPHSVTDTDTFPDHFYRLEFKRMDGKSVESMKSSYTGN